jgi:choline dehydrogenase-like flavoprotein
LARFREAGVQAGYPHNPDFNGADQEGVGLYQVTHKNGERFSAAKAYLTPHLSPAQPAGHHRRACHAHPDGGPAAPWAWNTARAASCKQLRPRARCC